jgi:hypothetical protein
VITYLEKHSNPQNHTYTCTLGCLKSVNQTPILAATSNETLRQTLRSTSKTPKASKIPNISIAPPKAVKRSHHRYLLQLPLEKKNSISHIAPPANTAKATINQNPMTIKPTCLHPNMAYPNVPLWDAPITNPCLQQPLKHTFNHII